jgi:Putative neutral zinc metallopeptidase
MGPFYRPLDRTIYIDLAFFEQLKRRFHAPGDFALAYVIAREVGHHVQTELGITDKVQAMKERSGDVARANALQVRMELQADCLAGVWASLNNKVKSLLEPGASRRPCRPLRRSGMTTCSARCRAGWCRNPSLTAPRRNACAGSARALKQARHRRATPSVPLLCSPLGALRRGTLTGPAHRQTREAV